MIKKLLISQLDNETFKEFGTIIDVGDKVPTYDEGIFKYYDSVAVFDTEEACGFSILDLVERPLLLSVLEKHNKTEELMLTGEKDLIFIVALSGELDNIPEPKSAKAFILKVGQGVIFKRGIWHWAPFSISGNSRVFFMYKNNTITNKDIVCVDLEKKMNLKFEIL